MIKTIHFISYSVIVLALITILTLLYWFFYPYKVMTYNTEKSTILNKDKNVEAGGILRVQSDLNHYTTGLIATVSPQLIDGSVINYPDFHFITRKGHQVFERTYEIPKYLPTGTYHIEIQTDIRVNPIRTISILRLSEDFTINGCKASCNQE